jgi:hypothetical protein
MQQVILTILIGFAAGAIPSIFAYLAKKKELAAQVPLLALDKISKAEDKLREDLMAQVTDLKAEIRELKAENRHLEEEYEVCRQEGFSMSRRITHLELLIAEQGGM